MEASMEEEESEIFGEEKGGREPAKEGEGEAEIWGKISTRIMRRKK